MLFAVDIDGVCATPVGTDAYGAYLHEEAGVAISPSWRQEPGLSLVTSLLQDHAFTSWCAELGQEKANEVLSRGQYSAVKQDRCLPIDGAVPTLTRLAAENRIIYITNRMS